MKWNCVKQTLPVKGERCLGYCFNDYGSCSWTGIVEVHFDPSIGWLRCENYHEKNVRVLFWSELKNLDLPVIKEE